MRAALRIRYLWLALSAAASMAAAIAFTVRRRRMSARISTYTSQVQTEGERVTSEPYDPDDIADLPVPVRRYFETVLRPGQPHVKTVRLTQEGDFRLGDADTPWRRFTASQVYSLSPPGYVWDAEINLFPFASARVLDVYVAGTGLLRANLFGGIPVASAGPNPRMNEAELQRYLSETPWFPTALLPAAGVTWDSIDERSARATLDDGDVTATAVFHFDEEGYLTQLTADRYRQDIDAVAPWTGHYRAYERRDGMEIPTQAEVAWKTADSEVPYWRGTITEIDYRTG